MPVVKTTSPEFLPFFSQPKDVPWRVRPLERTSLALVGGLVLGLFWVEKPFFKKDWLLFIVRRVIERDGRNIFGRLKI
jgi:hypothetical protein